MTPDKTVAATLEVTDDEIRELDRLRAVDHDTIEDALSTSVHRPSPATDKEE